MAVSEPLRRLAPEAVFLAGAGRAILLQIAHPAVGRGVAEHSRFAEDPMRRFHGTLTYIYALTNGSQEQARRVRDWVDRAHAPVRGPAGPGAAPAYDARDPELQRWVAATLYDSARLVHHAILPPLAPGEAEALYRQYAVLGTALQMPADLWPADRADFTGYWDRQMAALSVTPEAAAVGRALLHSANVPAWARAALPLARLLTAGMLPPDLREAFGLPWSRPRDTAYRAAIRTAAVVFPRLPAAVRHAPMRHYLARI